LAGVSLAIKTSFKNGGVVMKTEVALRESLARTQAILDAAVDAIVTIDEQGIIESANPAVERMFGYQPSELIGKNVSMLMPAPHRERHDGYLQHYLQTGEAKVIGIGRELEAQHRGGRVFPIELTLSEVQTGGDRRHFTGIIRDITSRKQAEKALRQSQDRTQAILDAAVDAIITINKHGIVESANPAVERMFGYPPRDLIGRNVSMLMPSPHREQHDSYLRRYLQTGEAKVIGVGRELEAQRRDGSLFPIELALSEVPGEGMRYFTGIIRDITVRKQAEEALLRADALKDEFLANTSHELRTPLNGIIGIGQSMLDGAAGPLAEEQRRNLDMIVASGRRLANLVNDLLDFSKLRHEQIALCCLPTDLHALVEFVLTVSRTLIGSRLLRLFNRIDPEVPLVECDADRVQQILFNLVGNAIKFTPSGVVEVSAEQQDGRIEITVLDTGVGIPSDKMEFIFGSFSQIDGSTGREQGGTGLGLAITRQLVALHGGTIRVASEIGSGSRFTFDLPRSATSRAMLTAQDRMTEPMGRILSDVNLRLSSTAAVDRKKDGSGFHVLVVDDEPVNRQVLMNYLSLVGYDVKTATDGEEALAYLESGKPCDLMLLDVMMPKISGFEVCERIRRKQTPADLPVIMLTARNRVSDLVSGFGAGANDYLAKPFASDELLARVRVHLELAKINDSYARFVPRQFLEQLGHERILDVSLGDQVQREMTVLFSDIRDFTKISERMSPAETFGFVNDYLGAMEPAITLHKGVVDKFVGDAVMALFPQSPDDAISAALDMLQRAERLNAEKTTADKLPVRIGIGLHTGSLILGTIGARNRMDTTVISDAVNLASRVENLTKTYRVPLLITGETFQGLLHPGRFALRRIDRVLVQGKAQPVVLYEVLDALPSIERSAREKTLEEFDAGLAACERQEFAVAVEKFRNVISHDPADYVAKFLLARIEQLQKGTPTPDAGVHRMPKHF
jgi:PAS domain S-box-containing protein